jgi:hypothetical protein
MFGERPTFYRKTLGVVAIAIAIVAATAVWLQIADLTYGGLFDGFHYFSYFTIATTILAIIVLLYGGLSALNSERESTWNTVVHQAVIAASIAAGVLFHAIIKRSDGAETIPIDYGSFPMELFHTFLPIYLFLDWLINPYRAKIPWISLAASLAFPAAWLGFTLYRGYETNWYPYQFLNPQSEIGWAGVSTHIAGATVVLFSASLFLLVSNRLGHRLRSSTKTLALTR